MNVNNLAKYTMRRCKELRTFNIDTWIDETGYPKEYSNGSIVSRAKIPEGTVRQSLYMARGEKLYMGLLDCEPGFGNDEIELDIEYCFDTQVITLNYNNISLQDAYEDMEDDEEDNCYVSYELTDSESEYFQTSLVEDPMFEFDDEVMMITFFNEIRKRFYENKVPIKCPK